MNFNVLEFQKSNKKDVANFYKSVAMEKMQKMSK